MSDVKKWRRFEDLAAKIQRDLAPGAQVEQNVRVKGKASGADRQIDIAVRTTAGQFELFVVIDCKDYGVSVDVKDVEAFLGLVKDVGANKGALIAARGYTEAAKKVAQDAGVSLFTLVDAESEDWPMFVSIPCLVDDRSIKATSYGISSTELRQFDPSDIPSISVFRADGSRIGPLRDLVSKLWNERNISHEPGVHDVNLSAAEPTYFRTDVGLARVDLTAHVHVAKTLMFGQLPLVKVQGFRDDIDGSLVTRSITTDVIDFRVIQAEWQKVGSEEALAVKPIMRLAVASHYSLEGEEDDEPRLEENPRKA